MKSFRFFWSLLLAGALVTSCGQDPTPGPEPVPPGPSQLRITGSIVGLTKATDSGFDSGDAVGIYAVDYADASTPGTLAVSGNRATNTRFAYDGSSWATAAGSEIYWKDETTRADIYGYYPYSSTTPVSVTAYAFSVAADQTTAAGSGTLSGYEASDFLWAKASNVSPQSTPVSLTFGHRLSKVVLTLVAGTGFDEGLPVSGITVKLLGTKTGSTIDLGTGVATATGDSEGITLLKSGTTYKGIVIPQTVAAGTPLVEVTIGEDVYTHKGGYTFTQNKQHNFTITVNKAALALEVSSGGITPWEEEEDPYEGEADEEAAPTAVYAAGYEIGTGDVSVAAYWKDGVKTLLGDGTDHSSACGIFVSGTTVYTVGTQSNGTIDQAALWTNGTKTTLGTNESRADGVYVAGSNVYVAGTESNGTVDVAVYWKDGVKTTLGNGTEESSANSIFVSGGTVYVVGQADDVAVLWTDGLQSTLGTGLTYSYAESVFVSEGSVYVAGAENLGMVRTAALWTNGTKSNLGDGVNLSIAYSVYVSGGDVYVVGEESLTVSVATLWTNGTKSTLGDDSNASWCYSVFAAGQDVYVAGGENTGGGVLWQNGTKLPLNSTSGKANAVFVVPGH